MMFKPYFLAALPLLLSFVFSNETAQASQAIYFANSCYERESGDAAGYVVEQTGTGPHMKVRFYWSEGSFMAPANAIVTHYEASSGHITFSAMIPWDTNEPAKPLQFDAVQKGNRLEGALTSPWSSIPENIVLTQRSKKDALDPQSYVGTGYCGISATTTKHEQ